MMIGMRGAAIIDPLPMMSPVKNGKGARKRKLRRKKKSIEIPESFTEASDKNI